MKGYGQFCPIAKASEVLGERWTNLVIRELIAGSETFSDLRKGLPLISPSLLSSRLKFLEKSGIVCRTEGNNSISYHLTEAGQELKPIIMQLGVWGHRWVRTHYDEDDLDSSLLMWDIHRNIDVSYFPEDGRTVLYFEFTDINLNMPFWWLIIANGETDVCLKDPGYEIDLSLASPLKALTQIWMGDLSLMKAVRENIIKVNGSSALRKSMNGWLGTNYFADVRAAVKR